VVDVGDVADEGHLVAAAAQPPDEDVEGDGAAQVPDVWGVLDGGATHVDSDVPRGSRHELGSGAGGGIVKMQGHDREFIRSESSRGGKWAGGSCTDARNCGHLAAGSAAMSAVAIAASPS